MNVTEQSVTLSCYASGETLSARRKLHAAVTVGVSPVINRPDSRLTVKKETCRPSGDHYRPFVLRIEFHQTGNYIAWRFVQSRSLFWIINKIDLRDEFSQHYSQIWLLCALWIKYVSWIEVNYIIKTESKISILIPLTCQTDITNRQHNHCSMTIKSLNIALKLDLAQPISGKKIFLIFEKDWFGQWRTFGQPVRMLTVAKRTTRA